MCGLIGIINKNNKHLVEAERTIFKELLYVGALRGFDGTGFFVLTWENQTDIWKTPHSAQTALFKINNEKIPLFGKALFGHNRAATKGEKTEKNTHPFKEKHITLMHNGTLYNHKDLANTENDSHAICHALTTESPEKVIEKLLGAFALIWFNEKEEKLYAIRNKERPLYLINTEEFYFFISEIKMADWILDRHNIKIIDYTLLDPLDLYCFNFKNTSNINYEIIKLKQKTYYTNTTITSNNKDTKKNQDIQKIEKELQEAGITKNKEVIGYIYKSETISQNPHQWIKHYGIFEDAPNLDFICWSPIDLNQEYITCELTGVYNNAEGNINIHCIKAQPIIDEEILNKLKSTQTTKYTLNDIPLTDSIINTVKNKKCCCCSNIFKPSENIVLIPKIKTKFLNKINIEQVEDYTYYCEDCSSFFKNVDKTWIKRESKHK